MFVNQNITKRFDLNVGKKCNERCSFCYYLKEIESGDTRDLTTSDIMGILKVGRKWGKTRVDFTGGEPTIRKDLPQLIEFARSVGYETCCIITNGSVTATPKKLKEFIDAGLNDILVSLHAYDADSHDYLVKAKNAHSKVLQTLENAVNFGLKPRVNHVVNNLNYENVEKLADLVVPFEPAALNFIVFNPTRDAIDANKEIKVTYLDVAKYLDKVISKYESRISAINVRHLPFCFLKGHEKNIKTMWQLQYEKAEWDWCMDIIHKKGLLYMYGAAIVGMFPLFFHPRFSKTNWNTRLHDALQQMRMVNDRKKVSACGQCKMRNICDGVPKQYIKDDREGDLEPYMDGETILDPAHFIPRAELEDAISNSDYKKLPGTPYLWFGNHRASNNSKSWTEKVSGELVSINRKP